MKLAASVKLGIRLLIFFNLLMAFGAIWFLQRMSPAIEVILARNEQSLHSCQNMLVSALAFSHAPDAESSAEASASFDKALTDAQRNITEPGEDEIIASIRESAFAFFSGRKEFVSPLVETVSRLEEVNRIAMKRADSEARRFGLAGAWCVAFLGLMSFWVSLLFVRSLNRNLSAPLKEIFNVFKARKDGDLWRRCSGLHNSAETMILLQLINSHLDEIKSDPDH